MLRVASKTNESRVANMDILPLHFRVLYYGGLWWETDEQHWFLKYIWKPLIVGIILVFALSMTSALTVSNINVKIIARCLFISLTIFALFFKMINFLCKRQSMIELLSEFRESICLPRTTEESDVLKENTRLIPLVFKCYLCMGYSCATVFLLLPLLRVSEGTVRMNFPFATYEICSKENLLYFTVTYVFQAFLSIIAIGMNTSLDTILAALICLTCGQIDLCCHRFTSPSQISMRVKIKRCVVHHSVIKNIVRHLESIFMGIIVPFLFLSLVTICTSVYNLSQSGIANVESIPFLMYTITMLMQVFYYCWFGNEIKLKGTKISETMYNYDWQALQVVERRDLLYVMIVCQKQLSLSYHGYCAISMDTYIWILNSSYAAYNLLLAVTKSD